MSEVEESRGEGVGRTRSRNNKYLEEYEDSASDYIEEEEEEEEEEKVEVVEEKNEEEANKPEKDDGEQVDFWGTMQTGEDENETKPAENGSAHDDGTTEKKKKKKKKKEDGEGKRSKKKKKDRGGSSTDGDSEEEDPAPTPPLFNGHALTNGVLANRQNTEKKQERAIRSKQHSSEVESHSESEFITREEFHSLRDVYNNSSRKENLSVKKDPRSQTPLTDEEELAGVSVKQLRSSYLNQAQENKSQHQHQAAENHKAEVNKTINITSLVDTYSSPPPRTPTPSRPDDLAPVSLRSLKSAYEASATGSNSAISRHSSSSGGSPGGCSPAPKEELNVSLHQLREEYCRSVQDGHIRAHTPSRASPETGVSIRQLTRSMTDLRDVGQESNNQSAIDCDRSALASVNVKALTRSFSDLTRLSDSTGLSTSPRLPKEDIGQISVSVKALRASYGDLPRAVSLSTTPVPRPRTSMPSSKIPRPHQHPSSKTNGVITSPRQSDVKKSYPPPSPSTGYRSRKLPDLPPAKASPVNSGHARSQTLSSQVSRGTLGRTVSPSPPPRSSSPKSQVKGGSRQHLCNGFKGSPSKVTPSHSPPRTDVLCKDSCGDSACSFKEYIGRYSEESGRPKPRLLPARKDDTFEEGNHLCSSTQDLTNLSYVYMNGNSGGKTHYSSTDNLSDQLPPPGALQVSMRY